MKRPKSLLGVITYLFCMIHISTFAEADVIKRGDTLPVIQLPAPENPNHQNYLGLKVKGPFAIQDIKAKVVIIQIYQESCLHCRKEAPTLNKFYRLLNSYKKTKGKVKIIGIAAQNDIHYVKLFQKEYKVPFPLFPDRDLSICEKLRHPGKTPFFIGVKLNNNGVNKVFYTQLGPVKQADKFLRLIVEKSGLK